MRFRPDQPHRTARGSVARPVARVVFLDAPSNVGRHAGVQGTASASNDVADVDWSLGCHRRPKIRRYPLTPIGRQAVRRTDDSGAGQRPASPFPGRVGQSPLPMRSEPTMRFLPSFSTVRAPISLGARPSIPVGRARGSCELQTRSAEKSMPRRIGDDVRRGLRTQPPRALRVAAAWGHLPRCASSTMRWGIASSARLAAGPTALATRLTRILGRAPRQDWSSGCGRAVPHRLRAAFGPGIFIGPTAAAAR